MTAFVVLSHLIAGFEFEEAVTGHAVASAVLRPTLSLDGPQRFSVRRLPTVSCLSDVATCLSKHAPFFFAA